MATGNCLITKILQNNFSKQLTEQLPVAIDLNSMVGKNYGSQWLPSTVWLPTFFKISSLCLTEERNSCRFDTTKWGNDDRIFILGWTIPLSTLFSYFCGETWPEYAFHKILNQCCAASDSELVW